MPRKKLEEPSRLRVVSSNEKAERQPITLTLCRVCERDTGVATNLWLDALASAYMDKRLKMRGGGKARVCAYCLSRGKVTLF